MLRSACERWSALRMLLTVLLCATCRSAPPPGQAVQELSRFAERVAAITAGWEPESEEELDDGPDIEARVVEMLGELDRALEDRDLNQVESFARSAEGSAVAWPLARLLVERGRIRGAAVVVVSAIQAEPRGDPSYRVWKWWESTFGDRLDYDELSTAFERGLLDLYARGSTGERLVVNELIRDGEASEPAAETTPRRIEVDSQPNSCPKWAGGDFEATASVLVSTNGSVTRVPTAELARRGEHEQVDLLLMAHGADPVREMAYGVLWSRTDSTGDEARATKEALRRLLARTGPTPLSFEIAGPVWRFDGPGVGDASSRRMQEAIGDLLITFLCADLLADFGPPADQDSEHHRSLAVLSLVDLRLGAARATSMARADDPAELDDADAELLGRLGADARKWLAWLKGSYLPTEATDGSDLVVLPFTRTEHWPDHDREVTGFARILFGSECLIVTELTKTRGGGAERLALAHLRLPTRWIRDAEIRFRDEVDKKFPPVSFERTLVLHTGSEVIESLFASIRLEVDGLRSSSRLTLMDRLHLDCADDGRREALRSRLQALGAKFRP